MMPQTQRKIFKFRLRIKRYGRTGFNRLSFGVKFLLVEPAVG